MLKRFILLAVFLIFGGNLFCAVPIILDYQGRLLDTDGVPLASGSYDMTFRLYTQESGGTALWTESHTGANSVQVTNGFFSVRLGEISGLDPGVFDNSELWLETSVTINSVVQTFSRVRLTAVPYAINSARLDNIQSGQFLRSDVNDIAQGEITFENKITVSDSAQLGNDSGDRTLITGVLTAGDTSDPNVGYHIFGDRTSSWSDMSNRNDVFVSGDFEVYEDVRVGDDLTVADHLKTNNSFLVDSHLRSPAADSTYDIDDPDDDIISIYDHFQVVGDANVEGDLWVWGTKYGYVSEAGLNSGQSPLEQGDVVEIVGFATPLQGNIPVIKVRKCKHPRSKAVVGVIDRKLKRLKSSEGKEEGFPIRAVKGEARASRKIVPGEYCNIVTSGAYSVIKVDADAGGEIQPGDLLVSAPTPGYAMKENNPAPGTIIGKALGSLSRGRGTIPAIIILH